MNQETEKSIEAVCSFARGSSSCLYSDFWPTQKTAFEDLPLLTREHLVSYPDPDDRLFIPKEEIEMLRATSGTTGSGPLFVWRDRFPTDHCEMLKEGGVEKCMMFFLHNFFPSSAIAGSEVGIEMFFGDAKDVPRSARIITDIGIDTLFMTPSIGIILSQHLERLGCIDQIYHIMLWGEQASHSTYSLLRKLYPNASFYFNYAMTEAGDTIGYARPECDDGVQHKHIRTEDYYPEIIDGELVITSLRVPHAMPLIRYRTGDRAEWVSGACQCGDTNPRIMLGERIDGDVVRVGGGEVRADEVDRVLKTFNPFIEPIYTVVIREMIADTRRIYSFEISLIRRSDSTAEEVLREKILLELRRDFKLSHTMTLGGAIKGGIFSEPSVRFVKPEEINLKNPKIRFIEAVSQDSFRCG